MSLSGKASGLNALRDRFERLSEREKILVGALGLAVVAFLMVVLGFFVGSGLSDFQEENEAMRRALKEIDLHRDSYQRSRAKTAQLEVRIGKGSVQLEGLLETAANQSEVVISETNERQPVPVAGKKFMERNVDIRIRKVTLSQLANFLRRVETGPNLVVVTSLHTRVRDDRHEDLEVELTVTTWERAPDAKAGKKDKEKDKDKEKEGDGAGAGGGKESKG